MGILSDELKRLVDGLEEKIADIQNKRSDINVQMCKLKRQSDDLDKSLRDAFNELNAYANLQTMAFDLETRLAKEKKAKKKSEKATTCENIPGPYPMGMKG